MKDERAGLFSLHPSAFILLLLLLTCRPAKPQLIFVGLDGADWQLLDRYMADGTMPQLAALVARGERRVLRTQHPPLSPLLWTTMMTGVSPLEHRVLDFVRFNPATHELEPITSDERAVPAIWNMVSSNNKRVDVIGLWATYPPEAVNGSIVSDREIASGERDPMQRTILETDIVHRLALEHLRADKPDLAIIYFEGTDAVAHINPNPASAAVREYFANIDRKLGEYAEMNADLVIASDHGFRWFGDRPTVSSTAPGTAAQWHRDEGVYLYVKRGSTKASTAQAASVDQICATLLALMDLPPDERLAKSIVANTRTPVDYRRKFHRAQPGTDTRGANESLEKLRSLGYLSGGGTSTSTRTAPSYDNEALLLRAKGRNDEALKAFASALAIDPKSTSVQWNLTQFLRASKDPVGDLTRAMEGSPQLHLYRGRYRLEANDCRGALTDFQQAADDAIKFASIGTAQTCLGNKIAANAAFRKSLTLDPNQPQVRAFLQQ